MQLDELIIKLCSLSGPSGSEDGIAPAVCELLAPLTDELRTDPMGNVIAVRKSGLKDARKLLLDAHMDEIGFIITGAEEGFLRFDTIGGVDSRMLPTREIKVLTEPPIYGIIDTMPPHVLSPDESDKATPVDKLVIDIGMTQEDAQAAVPAGTPAVYAVGCERLGATCIAGKALDDRACVAILIRIMELLRDRDIAYDIYCLVSTQEELGMRGAVTAAFGTAPDRAIVLDATHASTPDEKSDKTFALGKGPAIAVGPNLNRELVQKITALADKLDIPYQTEVLSGNSGTNAWPIQISREGVATALISLPVRYMHTPVEVADIADAEEMAKLVCELIAGGE